MYERFPTIVGALAVLYLLYAIAGYISGSEARRVASAAKTRMTEINKQINDLDLERRIP